MNPYETLGVPREATQDEIRKAFRAIARQAHPDRAGGDHDRMAEANDAYALLSDPERRKRFDETGSTRRPPSLEEKVQDMLMRGMAQVFAKLPPDVDAVRFITSNLNGAISDARRKQADVREQMKDLEKRRARLEDQGFFAGLFDAQREQHERALRNLDADIEVMQAALERMRTMRWKGGGSGMAFALADLAADDADWRRTSP